MKRLMIAAIACSFAFAGAAQAATCKATATSKNLHGAALTSFMKKCEKDAAAACAKQATTKKLKGAAKASFTKKCVRDAVGS
jgi:psiF repeat